MPCYLFTFHVYGSWLPDRDGGFVRRGERLQPSDAQMATIYRENQSDTPIAFDDRRQQILIDAALEAAEFQNLRLHHLATDPSHVHLLVSWKTDNPWETVRSGLRSSLSRHLNRAGGKRDWFAKTGSRKRVRDQDHFNYLTNTYLPNHRGRKWSEARQKYQ